MILLRSHGMHGGAVTLDCLRYVGQRYAGQRYAGQRHAGQGHAERAGGKKRSHELSRYEQMPSNKDLEEKSILGLFGSLG